MNFILWWGEGHCKKVQPFQFAAGVVEPALGAAAGLGRGKKKNVYVIIIVSTNQHW